MPQDEFPAGLPPRVVWQLTDGGTEFHERFVRSVQNLVVDLEPDGAQVEVVAHGAGLDLLLPGRGTAQPVRDLKHRGVTFAACQNTLRSRLLTVEDLIPEVQAVTSVVGHVVRRQQQGWSYLRA